MGLSARAECWKAIRNWPLPRCSTPWNRSPTTDLLADLGAAYALRVDHRTGRWIGYAIDYLNRSLQKRPNSGEVVFNLALVYERMNSYENAIDEWQRYLKLDPRGAWREDAERRLSELELKKKSGSSPRPDFR